MPSIDRPVKAASAQLARHHGTKLKASPVSLLHVSFSDPKAARSEGEHEAEEAERCQGQQAVLNDLLWPQGPFKDR